MSRPSHFSQPSALISDEVLQMIANDAPSQTASASSASIPFSSDNDDGIAASKQKQHCRHFKKIRKQRHSKSTKSTNSYDGQAISTTTSSPDYERTSYRGFQLQNENEIINIDDEEDNEGERIEIPATTTAVASPVVEAEDLQPSPSLSEIHYNPLRNNNTSDDFLQNHLFSDKPNYVAGYAYEVVQNLFKSQKSLSIKPLHTDRELLLHENLIDLMSVMHSRLHLSSETFFLAANMFTNYMAIAWSNTTPSNSTLIVIVATSLFIAAKYEEIYAPPLSNYHQVLSAYVNEAAAHSMLDFEGAILTALNFQLFGPTRLRFLEAYLSQTELDDAQKNFCLYLLELTQLNHALYKYHHSEIAAATILLSEKFKNISGRYFWNHNLELLTNYKQRDLYACVDELYTYLVHVSSNRTSLHIYTKYSDPVHNSVALIDYDLSHNVNNTKPQESSTSIPSSPIPSSSYIASLDESTSYQTTAHYRERCQKQKYLAYDDENQHKYRSHKSKTSNSSSSSSYSHAYEKHQIRRNHESKKSSSQQSQKLSDITHYFTNRPSTTSLSSNNYQ